MKSLKIHAGTSSSGRPVFEDVAVEEVDRGCFRILRTPGLVLGVARDDEISYDPRTCNFALQRRGGRVAVQLFLSGVAAADLESLAERLGQSVAATWDGLSDKQAVFSFPVSAGFEAAESVLNEFVARYPKAEWYYGNVYGDDGTTPLGWWNEQ